MPYYHDYSWGWVSVLVTGMAMLLLMGGLATLLVIVLRTVRHGLPHHGAERILEERYARGEIDDDELAKRRATLRRTN